MRTKKTVQEIRDDVVASNYVASNYVATLSNTPIDEFLQHRLRSIYGNATWAPHSYHDSCLLTKYDGDFSEESSLASQLYFLRDTYFAYDDLKYETGFRFGTTAIGTYEFMRVLDVLRPYYLKNNYVPVYHPDMLNDFDHTMLRELYGYAPEALMGDNAYEANNANADRLYLLTAIKIDKRTAELDTKYGCYSSI